MTSRRPAASRGLRRAGLLADALGLSQPERMRFTTASNRVTHSTTAAQPDIRPAQLPGGPPDFVGRSEQLDRLTRMTGRASRSIWSILDSCCNDAVEAIEKLEQWMGPARAAGHERAVANALGNIADSLMQLDRFERAESIVREALELHRRIGNRAGFASATHKIGRIRNHFGEYRAALDYSQAAMSLAQEIGHEYGHAAAQCDAAYALCHLDRLDEATRLAEGALRFARSDGLPDLLAMAHYTRAVVYHHHHANAEAIEHYQQAGQWAAQTGDLAIERQARAALADLALSGVS